MQSLFNLKLDLVILIVDKNPNQFDEFKREFGREIDASSGYIDIQFSQDLFVDLSVDVCIVATPASFRCEVIEFLNFKNQIRNWIIEKPLSNSLLSLKKISLILENSLSTYVNIPRETMKSYINFKSVFTSKVGLCKHISITGSEWGLASNTIHFLRLLEWLSESKFQSLHFEGPHFLIPTKRNNFFDLRAKLVGTLKNECTVELIDNEKFGRFKMEFVFSNDSYFIYEEENLLLEGFAEKIFSVELQSSLTAQYVSDLLLLGKCELPKMNLILHLEHMMLSALIGTTLYNKKSGEVTYT